MTAYRFCRTDDMGLLVEAWERCRGPEDADAPPLDREGFKRLVREIDLWCSSCMVAFEGRDTVGVLLGAKRPEATLVYGLRVHPAHRRRGHGRHLLTSLRQKLAILGPPRLVAEVPEQRVAARATFTACGWRAERSLRDWLRREAAPPPAAAELVEAVVPITFDAIESVENAAARACWRRHGPGLARRAEQLTGLGFHSLDRLEAWALCEPGARAWQILRLGKAPGALGGLGLAAVVGALARAAPEQALLLERAAPDELDPETLRALGFRAGADHLVFATEAKAA